MPKVLYLGDVLEITELSMREIREKIEAGEFPKPIKEGGELPCWDYKEFAVWNQEGFLRPTCSILLNASLRSLKRR